MTERCVSSSRSSRASSRSMAMPRRSTMFAPIARSFAAMSARIRSRSSRITSGSAMIRSRISCAMFALSAISALVPLWPDLSSPGRAAPQFFHPGRRTWRQPLHGGLPAAGSEDLLPGLRPVLQELLEPLVGEDMARHGLDDRGRRRDHVGADLGAIDDMVHRPDGGRENLGPEVVVVVDRADVVDQVNPVEVRSE